MLPSMLQSTLLSMLASMLPFMLPSMLPSIAVIGKPYDLVILLIVVLGTRV